MKNIQKSHWAHIGSIWSILSSSVHSVLFSLFCPLKFYSVQFYLIQCTSVLFGPFSPYQLYSVYICAILFTSVHFFYFSPFQFYSGHSVHFGHIRSIFVLFDPFCPLQSSLSIQSNWVLFGPSYSYSVHLVPIQFIRSYSIHLVHFDPFWYT